MKKLFITIMACLAVTCVMAQGWPANYGGVMLQGFYWDYYDDEGWGSWSALEGQADDLEGYIDLIWVPNSARTKNDYCLEQAKTDRNWLKDMGYMPCWWLNHDNTIFGNTSELKSMISTYKAKGIGIIEDVVINHKNGENSWCDFPEEHVVGTKGTYDLEWTLDDICYNDNGGACIANGFNVSGAADTGDDFDGCRDLDHTGANVQKNVKTYLDFLQKELGYAGFRYDMVKGYGPQYIGIYNAYAKPTFSVGEFWDSWEGTKWWVDGTKQNGIVQSAAFDFPLKFLINYAFNGDFSQNALSGSNALALNNNYKRYSVTFVDNHDTYRDGSKMSNDNNVLAANAFILSMPGTPCIFLPHWKTHKDALKRMIRARKAAGITNQSKFESYECNGGAGRSFYVHGSNATIQLLLGDCGYEPESSEYRSVWNGNNFKMYISESVSDEVLAARPSGSNANLGTARVDKPSGTYYQEVTVNVLPSDPFTTLVYSTDGSTPSVNNTIPASGKNFVFNQAGNYSLNVGISDGTTVKDVQTYTYAITDQEINDITIYVRADKDPLYLYAWDANETLTDAWPGTKLTEKKSVNGVNFYYKTFDKSSAIYTLSYILNQGSDATKTPDQTGISSTIFTALSNGSAENLTATYTGYPIEDPIERSNLITVYVEANHYPLKLYVWDSSETPLLGDFPGKQMNHTTCINGKTWFYETIEKESINLIVSKGSHKSTDFKNVDKDVYVSYNDYNDGEDPRPLTDKTAEYAGYPHAWYEQGEVCAFFTDENNWDNVYAWVWSESPSYYNYSNDNTNNSGWPGNACTLLGYNEYGQKLYKWTYNGSRTSYPEKIIFNNNVGGDDNQTADCTYENGSWFGKKNIKSGQNQTSAGDNPPAPSTEISIAALGDPNPPKETNWNGNKEQVAQKTSTGSETTMSKAFTLEAGNYLVQAIVRGTNGGSVTLTAKGQSASVDLTGLDGAKSSVQTNGIVDEYDLTATNNGWQKVELPAFTLTSTEKVTVTLTSGAAQWQLGALKVLPGTTKTKALSDTYNDESAETSFSLYERVANRNALTKAVAGTLPASLSYNVIVNGVCANLKLTDGNYSFNNSGEAFTASSISYDRTFEQATSSTRGSEQYNTSTIWLPFALTAAEAEEAGTFWGLESFNATTGEINFEKVEAPQANVPYLFDPAKANPFSSLTNKEIPTTLSLTVTKNGFSFVGVNERTRLVSGKDEAGNPANVTYYGYKDGTFVRVGEGNGANINPFRAYLKTASTNAARIAVLFDGEYSGETGIQVVKPAVEPKGEQRIYNLSGQRVQTPSKKGIYIKGGKKFVIK